MFAKLKQRFQRWAEEVVRRENARLRQETLRLKEEIERETGRPIELTAAQRSRLAELTEGMDSETLKEISVFDPEQFKAGAIERALLRIRSPRSRNSFQSNGFSFG